MLGGLQAFGVLGIILGPVIFATAAAILDVLRETQPSQGVFTGDASAGLPHAR
jgi:predicted PurR-regulated permease PerM